MMRTALITETSSGFGLATTLELSRRGWRMFATMRDLEKRGPLEEALKQAGTALQVEIKCLDVTKIGAMKGTVDALLTQTNGRLDAVIHNAGVAIEAAFEDLPESHLRRVMETNFFGVLELTRQLLPHFRKQRRGRIVIVSSDAAFSGEPANSIYCASKWAIEGWAESLAYEIEPFGIEILLVEPGPYRTEIWSNSPRIKPPGGAYAPLLDQLDLALKGHLEKNARDPREVAEVIAAALDAHRPRFRYPVGPFARAAHIMRGKIPNRLQRKITRGYLGLNRVKL
jgi:NAD(P)-dependent dehydrogenase (short-subunit alcohol dehydrogenase family)